jgi:SAM-dependent methyltransferase
MSGVLTRDGEANPTTSCVPPSSVSAVRAPDPAFADPRLAVLYDVFDDDRCDLDAYVAIVEEVEATTVVDIGCGTGSLAVRLSALGLRVVGVDPAGASLDVARAKPYADRVTWLHGDATVLNGSHLAADLVVMTGNVAQVFVFDVDWARTLDAVHECLRPGGWFVFETRRPEVRDWERWDVPPTTVSVPGGASVVATRTVTEVALPLVTFETSTTMGDEVVPSSSTLRFRGREEVEADLREHNFQVVDVREAPDRLGKELVFLACRPHD